MWWGGSELIDLFIGERQAAVARAGQAVQWMAAEEGLEHESQMASWMRRIDDPVRPRSRFHRGAPRLRVWVSGALARPFLVPGAATTGSREDARQVARSMCPDQTGLPAESEVWLDELTPGLGCMAVGLQRARLESICKHARQCGLRLQCVKPWWTLALQAALEAQADVAMVGINDGESLVTLAGVKPSFSLARAYESTSAADATARLRRLRLSSAELVGPLLLVNGAAAGSTAHAETNEGEAVVLPSVPFGAQAVRLP